MYRRAGYVCYYYTDLQYMLLVWVFFIFSNSWYECFCRIFLSNVLGICVVYRKHKNFESYKIKYLVLVPLRFLFVNLSHSSIGNNPLK